MPFNVSKIDNFINSRLCVFSTEANGACMFLFKSSQPSLDFSHCCPNPFYTALTTFAQA